MSAGSFVEPRGYDVALTGTGAFLGLVGVCLCAAGAQQGDVGVVLLGALALAALFLSYALRPPMQLAVGLHGHPHRCVVGEAAPYRLAVTNPASRSAPPARLRVLLDHHEPFELALPAYRAGLGHVLPVLVDPVRRGETSYLRLRYVTSAPFGLVRRTLTFSAPAAGLVHPVRTLPAPLLRLAGDGDEPAGQVDPGGTEFHAVRDYRPGDAHRRVHWRTTARRGRLAVVERERTHGRRLVVLLAGRPRGGTDGASWERLVARGAWSVAGARADGAQVRLVAASWAGADGEGLEVVDVATATGVLDWFARLGATVHPSPAQLRRVARELAAGDRLVVLAGDDVPPAWWDALRDALGPLAPAPVVVGP